MEPQEDVYPLIGRDRLLGMLGRYIIHQKGGLYLIGENGLGKSAILRWIQKEPLRSNGVLVSCYDSRGVILKAIAQSYGITTEKKRPSVDEIETAVLNAKPGVLLIDHGERVKMSLLKFLEPLKLRQWRLIIVTDKIQRDARKLFVGLRKFQVESLDNDKSVALATRVILQEGLKTDPEEVARNAKGYPARIVYLARGEPEALESEIRPVEDEINIAPLMMLVAGLGMMTRVIGLGTGTQDLYIVGGVVGVLAFLLVRSLSGGGR